jgi:hypothetical protein
MEVFTINYSNVGAESIDIPYTLIYIPKPTNLTTVTGDSRVYLYWNIPPQYSYISNYTIYRGSEPGNETFYKKIGNVMHFYDSNVTNGQTYFYRVCAGSVTNEGPLSNSTSATPLEPITPITYEPSVDIDLSLLPFIIWISIIATFFVVFIELRFSYRKWE